MDHEIEFTLKPIISGYSKINYPNKKKGTPYYEQILMYEEEYPFAMVHIDMFYQGRSSSPIYDILNNGETVKVKVTFEIIKDE